MRDLEIAGHDRPVPEQPPDQALLDLDGADPREAYRGRAAPQRAVHDEQLLSRQHDERPLPAPHSA